MPLWLGVLLVIAAFIVWFLAPRKGGARNLDSPGALSEAVRWLYNLGTEGGEIRVEIRGDASRYVTLTKHIRRLGDVELTGVLPVKNLSPDRYSAVREELVGRNIPCSDPLRNGDAQLQVQSGSDLKNAESFVRIAMESGFGVAVSSDCVYYVKKLLLSNRPALTGVPDP